MRDPRALANAKNLDSYRAWQREGLGWSGLDKAVLVSALSVPAFAYAATLIEHVTRGDPGALVRLMGAAMAAYLVAVGGLMLAGLLRLKAWKRAHPWAPPSPGRLAR